MTCAGCSSSGCHDDQAGTVLNLTAWGVIAGLLAAYVVVMGLLVWAALWISGRDGPRR